MGSGTVVNEFWIKGKRERERERERERGILGFEKLNNFLLDVYIILIRLNVSKTYFKIMW